VPFPCSSTFSAKTGKNVPDSTLCSVLPGIYIFLSECRFGPLLFCCVNKKASLKGWLYVVAEAGFERATFGLSICAGNRRVSHTATSQVRLGLLALWVTPLTKKTVHSIFSFDNEIIKKARLPYGIACRHLRG